MRIYGKSAVIKHLFKRSTIVVNAVAFFPMMLVSIDVHHLAVRFTFHWIREQTSILKNTQEIVYFSECWTAISKFAKGFRLVTWYNCFVNSDISSSETPSGFSKRDVVATVTNHRKIIFRVTKLPFCPHRKNPYKKQLFTND